MANIFSRATSKVKAYFLPTLVASSSLAAPHFSYAGTPHGVIDEHGVRMEGGYQNVWDSEADPGESTPKPNDIDLARTDSIPDPDSLKMNKYLDGFAGLKKEYPQGSAVDTALISDALIDQLDKFKQEDRELYDAVEAIYTIRSNAATKAKEPLTRLQYYALNEGGMPPLDRKAAFNKYRNGRSLDTTQTEPPAEADDKDFSGTPAAKPTPGNPQVYQPPAGYNPPQDPKKNQQWNNLATAYSEYYGVGYKLTFTREVAAWDLQRSAAEEKRLAEIATQKEEEAKQAQKEENKRSRKAVGRGILQGGVEIGGSLLKGKNRDVNRGIDKGTQAVNKQLEKANQRDQDAARREARNAQRQRELEQNQRRQQENRREYNNEYMRAKDQNDLSRLAQKNREAATKNINALTPGLTADDVQAARQKGAAMAKTEYELELQLYKDTHPIINDSRGSLDNTRENPFKGLPESRMIEAAVIAAREGGAGEFKTGSLMGISPQEKERIGFAGVDYGQTQEACNPFALPKSWAKNMAQKVVSDGKATRGIS